MKTLVVYYSRTGTTKTVAEEVAQKLGADVEEIKDSVKRTGIWGWLISGRDGMKRNLTKIRHLEKDPGDYDLVVVGTPIWAGNISAPTRTFLRAFKKNFKKVAFFCTMGGRSFENTFKEMTEEAGKEPVAELAIREKELNQGEYESQLEEFASKLKS